MAGIGDLLHRLSEWYKSDKRVLNMTPHATVDENILEDENSEGNWGKLYLNPVPWLLDSKADRIKQALREQQAFDKTQKAIADDTRAFIKESANPNFEMSEPMPYVSSEVGNQWEKLTPYYNFANTMQDKIRDGTIKGKGAQAALDKVFEQLDKARDSLRKPAHAEAIKALKVLTGKRQI